jgi:hypothetical protein
MESTRSPPPSGVIKRLLARSPPETLAEYKQIAILTMQSPKPTASEALDLAEMLVGQWPYLNAHDPETYSLTIAAMLREWPIMLAEECCDPRTGLARTREMPPTAASVTAWCTERYVRYRAVSPSRPQLKQIGGTK